MSNDKTSPAYALLTPDLVLNAVESLGFFSDACICPLNSYENRVYMVGIEDGPPLIAKFYRPQRWSNEQIIEEHAFSQDLFDLDVPIVPPITQHGSTLFEHEGYRFAIYPRKGGQAPDLDNDDNLYILGQQIGRIHALGKSRPFDHRPAISVQSFGHDSRQFLLEHEFIPTPLLPAYETITEQLLEKVDATFTSTPYTPIRLHGDCHSGNILWRDQKPNFVDLDDARSGPAVQDLWMLLSGDRARQQAQMAIVIEGYEMFCDFETKELRLIESLRSLRQMHYAAWLARRWSDPAFPMHFPWFNTELYWSQHVSELREQLGAIEEPPLAISPF